MNIQEENQKLNEILAQPEPIRMGGVPTEGQSPYHHQDLDLCQWQVGPNGMFRPAASTVVSIPSGAYSTGSDDYGPFLTRMSPMSDEIVKLPESANIRVLDGIRRFWASRKRYRKHGLVFKRGVLLWGPLGAGKTVSVCLLTRDLIDNGGIVVFCGNPNVTAKLIQAIRRIEKERPLIVVFEDIDEIVSQHGEHTILSMLDGEQQTDNIVNVATTNYPERLGARIVNRPSRFDDRIFVGMPSEAARLAYLQKAVSGHVDVAAWAHDTAGLSIAHLRELVAAVLCLDQDYADVLARLRSMNERPKDVDGYEKKKLGYIGLAQTSVVNGR